MQKTRFALLTSLCLVLSSQLSGAQDRPVPSLILQITVDQLRGDLPERFMQHMGQGGFRSLFSNGVVYRDARHAHSNTETIVGHATLATGATPSVHGLIGNVWFDRASGQLIYNIQDERYPLLTADADVDESTEIDPTQRLATVEGRSPAAMLVSTFGDELKLKTAGKAKVFSVSIKDRGAVSMAGHAGKAFWFSKAAGQWVTSRFYYDQYPAWVQEFNAAGPAQRYANTHWDLLLDRSNYLFGDRDDQAWETVFGNYGRVFPHPYGPADGKYFTTLLTLSPAGDELTLDFVKELVARESIGADSIPDYLSVSFSSTDYVGHLFGPSSLEAEDNLLRLDRTLAELLRFIDERVGLDQTLVVLSADHGGPEAPGYLREFGIETDYVSTEQWGFQAGIQRVKDRLGIQGQLVREFFPPYIYLNRETLRKERVDPEEVERAVAQEVEKFRGVSMALSRTALEAGRAPDTPLVGKILNNHHPRRSGDIYVVFEPHWFINDFDGLTVAATHGSPWRYDTFVPVIFMGMGLQPQTVSRSVETTDIAPTLASIAGTKPPTGAMGHILVEALPNVP